MRDAHIDVSDNSDLIPFKKLPASKVAPVQTIELIAACQFTKFRVQGFNIPQHFNGQENIRVEFDQKSRKIKFFNGDPYHALHIVLMSDIWQYAKLSGRESRFFLVGYNYEIQLTPYIEPKKERIFHYDEQ